MANSMKKWKSYGTSTEKKKGAIGIYKEKIIIGTRNLHMKLKYIKKRRENYKRDTIKRKITWEVRLQFKTEKNSNKII